VVDTHCHLLPALDDGPRTLEAAVELAAALVESGVEHVVATPHLSSRFPTDPLRALSRARRLRASLVEAAIDLELTVAAEVSPTMALTAQLAVLTKHSIARRFVLIELLPDTRADFVTAVLARFSGTRLVPILAHPERCRAVQRRPRLLDTARRVGALVQVVAPSLVSNPRGHTAATAWRMLETGRADIVASDAHGTRAASLLAEAAGAISYRLGDAVSEALTRRRPGLVVRGRHPDEELG